MKDKNLLNNLPPFYIGQEVKANCNHVGGLIKDNYYIITSCFIDCCGLWVVTIGIVCPNYLIGIKNHRCTICSRIQPVKKEYEFLASRFYIPQQQSFPLMTFKEIVKKEKTEILINN